MVPDAEVDAHNGRIVHSDNPEGIEFPDTVRAMGEALAQPANDTLVFRTTGPDADDPTIIWRSGTTNPIEPEQLVTFEVGAAKYIKIVWSRTATDS